MAIRAILAAALPIPMILAFGMARAEEPQVVALSDFASVCPAALLGAGGLDEALARAGLQESYGATIRNAVSRNYVSADGKRLVAVIRQTFADSERGYCTVGVIGAVAPDAVLGLRATLEANPLLGPLDGEIIAPAPGIVSATLKRPGLAPLVVVILNASGSVASLALETWASTPPR